MLFHLLIIMWNHCSQLQGALNSREREISSLRRQLDAAQGELVGFRRDKEITIRENRRLQDDLATMTRENQVRYKTQSQVTNCFNMFTNEKYNNKGNGSLCICFFRLYIWRWKRFCMRRTN